MSVNTSIKKALNLFGVNVHRVPSPLFDNIVLPLPREDYEIIKEQIFLKRLNISIPKEANHPFIVEYHHATRIVERLDGTFFYDNKGNLKASIKGVELFVIDPETLFIISEVFGSGAYNILTNRNDVVVIDIGMNVATTALFFASKNYVEKIYSFELFPATYQNALRNIGANSFGNKIIPHQYGLGKENSKMVLPYSAKQKGRMGLNGLPPDNTYNDVVMQDVEIKKASDEIKRLTQEVQGKYIVCKMDCEGAEYEIIEDLNRCEVINKVDSYMIEWHYKKPDAIVAALRKNDYAIFYQTLANDVAGMLYAVKQ